MAKKARRYSFGDDILRLRMTNWARIMSTKTVVDLRGLTPQDVAVRKLELRIARIEAALKVPALKLTSPQHLASKLADKWKLRT